VTVAAVGLGDEERETDSERGEDGLCGGLTTTSWSSTAEFDMVESESDEREA